MNETLSAFGGASATQTNAVAAGRTVVAEYFVDFTAFGDRLTLELSALVMSADR